MWLPWLIGFCRGESTLVITIMFLIGLDHLLDLLDSSLGSHSPDPQLDTVVESGHLTRLQEDRSSRKLGLH